MVSVILDPPGQPSITGDQNLIEGQNVTFRCESEGGHPVSSMTWNNNNDILNSSNPQDIDGKLRSELSFIVKYNDDSAELICIVENVLEKKTISSTLNVTCKFINHTI